MFPECIADRGSARFSGTIVVMKRRLLLALILGIAGGAFGLGLARMLELNEPRLRLADVLCGTGVAIGLACGISRVVSALSASIAFVLPAILFLVRVSVVRRGGLPPMLGALTFPVPIGLAGLLFSGTPALIPRAGSVLSASAKRASAARVLCVLLASAGVLALAGARPWGSFVLAALAIALTALAAFDIRAWDRVASLAASSQPVEQAAPIPASTIDLGVGTQLRQLGPDAIHPYRGVASGPRRARHLLGDPDLAAQLLRGRAAIVSLIVVAAFFAAGVAMTPPLRAQTSELPTARVPDAHLDWNTAIRPVLEDVDNDGIEDLIGVRRPRGAGLAASSPCELTAVSGATFRPLWSVPQRPCTAAERTVDPATEVSPDQRAFFGSLSVMGRHEDDAFAIASHLVNLGWQRPTPTNAPTLYGFDPRSGEVRFQQDVPIEELYGIDGFALSHGRIYSFVTNGPQNWDLRSRDAKTGAIVWQSILPTGAGFRLFSSERRVYVAGSHRFDVIDRQSGDVLGTIE